MEHDSESPSTRPDDEPQGCWMAGLKFVVRAVLVLIVVAALVFGVCLLAITAP